MTKYYDPKDIAALMKFSEAHVGRLIKDNRIKAIVTSRKLSAKRRTYKVSQEALDEFIRLSQTATLEPAPVVPRRRRAKGNGDVISHFASGH